MLEMGRVAQEGSDIKSLLVSQICSISTAYSNSGRSDFIDWYHLLGVEENAGLDVIRKQYRKLALQLHPDKNKHPKAEIAFRLVSQAYVCLSDNAKRRAFDLQRLKYFYKVCNRIPYSNGNSPSNSSPSVPKSGSCSRRSFKDIREDIFKLQEAKVVVVNRLGTNMGSRIESPVFGSSEYLFRSNTQHKTRREAPLFDPSDNLVQGNHPQLQNSSRYISQGRRTFDSPIFEMR